jgi:FkbM family methyltransferase
MKPSLGPRFSSLLAHDPLCIVDVGARGGLKKEWQPIREHATFVGFEPEQAEAVRLQSTAASNERYIASALYSEVTRATLYHCQSPARSSLYHPNYEMISEIYGGLGAYEVERVDEIDVTTLDVLQGQGALPAPNFIKLDTQGCELDILKGATTALEGPLLALETEVEFLPLYRGQPLFADVDSFLRGKGFELVGFKTLYSKLDARFIERGMQGYASSLEFLRAWTSRLIGPLGMLKAESQVVYGDAIYVRRSSSFLSQASKELAPTAVTKAVVVSSVLKLYEYAFETLAEAQKRGLIGAEDANDLERYVHAHSRDLSPVWNGVRKQSARLFRRLGDPGRRRS